MKNPLVALAPLPAVSRLVRCTAMGVALFLLYAVSAQAQWFVSVNPGIKMGWVLGSGGGAFFGVEISVSALDTDHINSDAGAGAGLVFSTYRFKDKTIIHVGVEGMWYATGIEAGPTFVSARDGRSQTGLSVEAFFGALLFAHAGRTFMPESEGWWHAGFYAKAPIALRGSYSTFSPD
jgi:hypothetical protein